MNPAIFKAYDVRGLYPDELDARGALAIGRAVARKLGPGPVAVGFDMRKSAAELREAFVSGLRAEGADVIDIGRVATPILYFATTLLRAVGGAMITASHNPGAYNGFKLCGPNAVPIGIESGLREIRDAALALEGQACPPLLGTLRSEDVKERYYESLLELFPARPRLRAVIDAGNGIAGEAYAGLIDRLPLETKRLYFEPDGSFPNHEADPLKLENLADLQRAVLAERADLGIAFDGDGDRAVFVDETGEAIPADLMTALFCEVILERKLLGAGPGAAMLYDLRSSRIVPETLRARGAEPIRSRVGHAFMKAVMRERGACFGGELSGHYYFSFPSGYIGDDGAAAMMLLLEALDARKPPLSKLWRPYRRYRQSGEINRRVTDVSATLARVRAAHVAGVADELDGLTVTYPDWWFNLRPSNTEPLLRLNLEASSDAEVAAKRDALLALIEG
jgi:phosphomannomutase